MNRKSSASFHLFQATRFHKCVARQKSCNDFVGEIYLTWPSSQLAPTASSVTLKLLILKGIPQKRTLPNVDKLPLKDLPEISGTGNAPSALPSLGSEILCSAYFKMPLVFRNKKHRGAFIKALLGYLSQKEKRLVSVCDARPVSFSTSR